MTAKILIIQKFFLTFLYTKEKDSNLISLDIKAYMHTSLKKRQYFVKITMHVISNKKNNFYKHGLRYFLVTLSSASSSSNPCSAVPKQPQLRHSIAQRAELF